MKTKKLSYLASSILITTTLKLENTRDKISTKLFMIFLLQSLVRNWI